MAENINSLTGTMDGPNCDFDEQGDGQTAEMGSYGGRTQYLNFPK
jgi:hypothetical protein